MLWNWNTLDVCLISSSWQITSDAMFAGSCIGVILLVMALGIYGIFTRLLGVERVFGSARV